MFAPDPHPDPLTAAAPGHRDSASPAHLSQSRRGDLTCSPAQASLPLTSRDKELLAALRNPDALATIDPAEYAAWIERPEIQKAIAAQDDLDDRRERLQAAAHRAECLADNRLSRERLRAVLEATMDLTDESQRTDHRRAATALGRLSRPTDNAAYRSSSSPFSTRRAVGAPSSGPSPVASRQSPSADPPGQSPVASCQLPVSPSHAFPGLDTTIAAFLAAIGTAEDLHKAAELIANHRSNEIGAHNLTDWLERQAAPLRGAQFHAGRTVHHDNYDAVEQYIHAVHPHGTSTWIIECVLERTPDMIPTRWAIARINPDTS